MHLSPALTAVQLRDAIAKREMSALEVAQMHIERIEALEADVKAWKFFDPQAVLRQADAIDAALARGEDPGPLAGVPLGVKDLFDTADMPTGYGSSLYEGHRPAHDADAVRAARAAGACVMGKTVSTEFAYFTPGPTRNPWNLAHTPGGSSSGSAAAVACGMVPLAFGSQTAGSVIRPASYCGVFGLKPTFGAFSMQGAKAFAPSLDTLGWFARTADDLELMRCALTNVPYEPLSQIDPKALKLISCRTPQWPAIDAGGLQAWETAHQQLDEAGVSLRRSELEDVFAGLFEAQKRIMAFEAARSLAPEFRSHAETLSDALKQLLATGQTISEDAYQEAQALARMGRQQVLDWMGDADAVLTPAATAEAPQAEATGDPVFNRVWTLLGFPCVNVPGLLGSRGLPIGLQMVGRPGAEKQVLIAARAVHELVAQGAARSWPGM